MDCKWYHKILKETDILTKIFQRQAELNKKYGFDPNKYQVGTAEWKLHRGQWLNDLITCAISELIELRDCTYWKHFYKEAREGRRYELHDLQHAQVELVDLIHFVVHIAQVLDMGPEDLYELYCKKNAKNHARQDDDCTTEQAKDYELKKEEEKHG